MSENSEFIKGLYTSFAQGDVPAVLGALDPHIEWTEAKGFPTAGTYHSPEEVLNGVFAPLMTDWDGFHVRPSEFIDAGDQIVVLGTYSGTYKATGKSMETEFAHVWHVKNGKAVKFRQCVDSAITQNAMVP